MCQGYRRGFTAAEKTELWDRWQRGESLKAIGRAFGPALLKGTGRRQGMVNESCPEEGKLDHRQLPSPAGDGGRKFREEPATDQL